MILDQTHLPKRVGIFFIYDSQGIIDRYIPYMLRDLMENLSYLLVVINGNLSESGREQLLVITPNILVRENVGFDVWAYKEGLEYIGWDKLIEYDEIILANHTNFGPVYPFKEAFDAMNGRDIDFWGLTKHYGLKFDPYKKCKYGYIPAHIQSSFIAIRQSMVSSSSFRQHWDNMPPILSYEDSICYHEVIFTKYFEEKGYKSDVYINADDLALYQEYPLMLYPLELVKNRRCPIFKRKSFFNIYDEFLGVSCGQSTWELYNFLKNETSYDVSLIWESILRTCNISDIKDRSQLNFILPTSIQYPFLCKAKTALFIHLNDISKAEVIKKYAMNIPAYADIIIATSTEDNARQIEKVFLSVKCNTLNIIVISDKRRALIGFLLNMKDYVQRYEYICFIHDEHSRFDKPLYDNPMILVDSFAYKCYENVLASSEFVENVIVTFQNNPQLGLLTPPPPNHGSYFYTMGNEWRSYYYYTKELVNKLGLHVILDEEKPPIAPFGNCFWFRSKALQTVFNYDFFKKDFPPEPTSQQADDILHAMERIYSYAAQNEGYYTGWLLSDIFAKFEITNLNKQLRDCYQTLFRTFGILDRYPLLQSVSTCKNSLEILRQKMPLKEKAKMIIRKFLGIRGYEFLKKMHNKLYLWRGKHYGSS